ncbi:DNA repair protein Rad60 [Anticarsia gemmatalis]|uniref:DNA repair protein Rad60 n=1 Tax=Anticarsia gemmatalis TaxID=129554 RepID=UPI003F7595EF
MSSSDSDDDCYGNVAQKLQALKNKFEAEKVVEEVKTETKVETNIDALSKDDVNPAVTVLDDLNTTVNSTDNEELTLDAIIAKNSKPKRGKKRKSAEDTFEPVYERETRSARRTTANSRKASYKTASSEAPAETGDAEPARRGRTSRGKTSTSTTSRGRGNRNNSAVAASPRGRGAGPRARGGTPRGATPRARGRQSRRGFSWATSSSIIYSVGNTDEYPDQSDNLELFSSRPNTDDIQIIDDEEDPLATENEELSVKVYWQNSEVVRFKLRKFQKLSPIFKYFSEKESVGNDKLLFMYNDKILNVDDTPDSINYSIAKFIDGGIVSRDITGLVKQSSRELKDGIKIKFQCQNVKKPFETTIRLQDKLALAMMKCSEHLETPIERLKFYFDGDLVSSKSTPQELDLEGGECIDVKITS